MQAVCAFSHLNDAHRTTSSRVSPTVFLLSAPQTNKPKTLTSDVSDFEDRYSRDWSDLRSGDSTTATGVIVSRNNHGIALRPPVKFSAPKQKERSLSTEQWLSLSSTANRTTERHQLSTTLNSFPAADFRTVFCGNNAKIFTQATKFSRFDAGRFLSVCASGKQTTVAESRRALN